MLDTIEEMFLDWAKNDPWLFATSVILVMALEGLLLGLIFNYVSRFLGLEMPEGGGH